MPNIIKYISILFCLPILWFGFGKSPVDGVNPIIEQSHLDNLIDVRSTQNDDAVAWSDSIYNGMNWEERIGQLFMARAHSDLPQKHIDEVKRIIKEHHVGGLCFFQGTPKKQAQLSNEYQKLSKVPLMIAVDAEWGIGMRFKEHAISFPRQLTLGAIQDNSLIYDMGRDIAQQLKAVGMHVNFAPVVDVNNNINNPVINDRSFGEDKYNVAAKGYQYMKGMQDEGIMACAKHFPGHGDTGKDSHYDLPVIAHDRARLDSLELYPFKVLVDRGLQSMMIAHLHMPAIDTTKHVPTTLSQKTVTGLLRKEMNFEGLTFTDALEMKGVTKHFGPGEVALRAFQAGNDMLVLPDNFVTAYQRMKEALEKKEISEAQLEARVKKILIAKYHLGLQNDVMVDISSVQKKVDLPASHALKQKLFENAITVAANKNELIPIVDVQKRKFTSVAIGSAKKSAFQKRLKDYIKADFISVSQSELAKNGKSYMDKSTKNDVIIISLHNMHKLASKNFGLNAQTIKWINEVANIKPTILVVFGNPYSLTKFQSIDHVLQCYENDPVMQDVAAQGLMGVFRMTGALPITAGENFPFGTGYQTLPLGRLGYAPPAFLEMEIDTLKKIDALVDEMIKEKALPGCQILVAKKGRVVFEKAYGHHTYTKRTPVVLDDLYDVASVTKIASTTLAVMRLQGENKLDVKNNMGQYLSKLEGTNKAPLKINRVMAHHAGLKSWIPFYKTTMAGTKRYPKLDTEVYHKSSGPNYDIKVIDDLYMRNDYVDTVWNAIIESEVRPGGYYRYSDLGFIMMAELIQEQTGYSLSDYASSIFYEPMGLNHTTYCPTGKFSKDKIVPTEEDQYFRMRRVQGHVHDMGCAMLGGISGHAGLFSNAHDLGVIMHMLMRKGHYGGMRYLREEVTEDFTTRFAESTRRAIGFDMKDLNPNKKSYTSPLASDYTYGHTGFTGIGVWNDPAHDLTFVFLSNRTYPSSRKNKLNREEYRERIHSLIYQSFFKPKEVPASS